jgi:DNA-binding NarL/FixJ family response regulator
MRVILVGTDRERDRVRWQLQSTGLIVVGEYDTFDEARDSGVEADVFVMAADRARTRSAPASRPAEVEPLTPREIQVLELLADGLPNKAIAARLGISDQTVKFHVASITGKLGVANRTEAVRRAIRRGLITL